MSIKISVIIPMYNSEATILSTLNSVKNQTFTNYEVITVDDGSEEHLGFSECWFIVNHFAVENPQMNIKNIRQKNQGSTRARANGIERSAGKYFLLLDSDDLIDSKYMEKTFDLLENNKDCGFVYIDSVYHYPDGKTVQYAQPDYNFIRLIEGNYISYCSLFSKNAYYDAGGYNLDNFGYAEDYELYLRLGKRGWYGKHLAEPLFHYLIREDSVSHSRQQKMEMAKFYFIKKYPEVFPIAWQQIADSNLKNMPKNFMSER